VGITGGGQDTMVAEVFLDFEQVNARFDQMRGIAMTLMPSSALAS
jgi:hypothetical protein